MKTLRKKTFSPDQFQSIEESVSTLSGIIENINKENYNLLSIVFHDLRNPLTYIKMSLDVLLTGSFGEIPNEQKELLNKSSLQVDRLNKLIDDVLLIVKLENNFLKMNFTSISIVNILDDSINLNTELLTNKNLSLDKTFNDNISNSETDYKHLSIALNYLINYCIKSTENGGLTLSCYADEGTNKIIIDLKDTSECVGKENIPQIFDKFQCFGMMARKKDERTGLELSICKEIINNHNGEIQFDTNETNGNKFTITLPA